MHTAVKHYLTITGGYWAFTITDGAIRMLVVLHFHLLGYSPFQVAMLFLFYEFFGVVTNLIGGWLGARIGLNNTMHIGIALQIIALLMLSVPAEYLTVIYVMCAQALSGIAKDLNKLSAKASVKTLIHNDQDEQLFKWVARLTGSKNTLKGAGFFVGAALLQWVGFTHALWLLAAMLGVAFVLTFVLLPGDMGKMTIKAKFTEIFSNNPRINRLSLARFFLFGARDIWFVVALPVFLYEILKWQFYEIGGFMASWVIAYGIVQASVPELLKRTSPVWRSITLWAAILAGIPAIIAIMLSAQILSLSAVIIIGLVLFGIVFAINSAIHSYLIVSWSDGDKVAMNVGFYYMANAAGRLAGTVLSGLLYGWYGLEGSLYASSVFITLAMLSAMWIPRD